MRVEKTDEYREWIDSLKDLAGRARILMRVDRLVHGNPGSYRNLTHSVSELKVDVGPGYRVASHTSTSTGTPSSAVAVKEAVVYQTHPRIRPE
jgi:putative addiction module killer protein